VIREAASAPDSTGVKKAVLTLLLAGALLAAGPALGGGSTGSTVSIPAIGDLCLRTGASTLQGKLVASAPRSLTMTIDRGTGPLLAFGAAKLMLPVAPNATVLGSPHKGDTVIVHAVNCPNAAKTMISTVAGRIEVATKAASRKAFGK
jgi:hypothetical protein